MSTPPRHLPPAYESCLQPPPPPPHTQRVTKNHVAMKCYGLGLGLDTFRMVALDANFRRLEERAVAASYAR